MPVSNSYNSLSRGSAMISDSRDCSRFLEKKALWVARRDSRRIVGQPETEIRMPANFRVARDPFGMIGERESTMTRGRCDSLGLHRTALASDLGQPETEIRMPANFRVARDPFGMIGERESTMTRGRCDSLGLHRTALAS